MVSIYGMELFLHLSGRNVPTLELPFWALASDQAKERAKEIAGRYGVDFDTRERLELVDDFHKRGVDAVPSIVPFSNLLRRQPNGNLESIVKIDGNEVVPLGGVSGKVTVLCNENGSYVSYESDERGFNNPRGLWHSGAIDLAALGDSFVHGYCVPSDKNFVALIRRRYPATLNLGVAGHGPLLTMATLSEYLPQYRPKTVLWFYYEGNDLADLQIKRINGLLMRYLEDGFNQGLAGRQSHIDGLLMAEIDKQKAIEQRRREKATKRELEGGEQNRRSLGQQFGELIKLTALRQRAGLTSAAAEERQVLLDLEGATLDLFGRVLSVANARVSAWEGQLYFVYLPTWGRYAKGSNPTWGIHADPNAGSRLRARVLSLVKSLGIPIIDLHPVFNRRDPLALFPFREYGHYTEEGHELVAEEVINSISRANLGDPK
jgi:lysophospholipase L1-like esterase